MCYVSYLSYFTLIYNNQAADSQIYLVDAMMSNFALPLGGDFIWACKFVLQECHEVTWYFVFLATLCSSKGSYFLSKSSHSGLKYWQEYWEVIQKITIFPDIELKINELIVFLHQNLFFYQKWQARLPPPLHNDKSLNFYHLPFLREAFQEKKPSMN